MNNQYVSPAVVRLAWASFVSQVVIVITGGAVRLTASGLGCDRWPQCTPGKFVTTPEQGIHGAIEFGNRTLTGVLIIIAVCTLIVVWRMRPVRTDLRVLTVIPFAGIVLQAVIGGISVLLKLNPWVVGFHFVVSAGLVAATAMLVERVYTGSGPRHRIVSVGLRNWGVGTGVIALCVMLLGIVSTGAGPHAGDANAPRNGLSVELTYHLHATAAYLLVAATLVTFVWAVMHMRTQTDSTHLVKSVGLLLSVEALQAAVGITQARLGVPALLVGIHMGLAVLLGAAAVVMISRLGAPVATSEVD